MSSNLHDSSEGLALVQRYVVWNTEGSKVGRHLRLMGMNPVHDDAPDNEAFKVSLAEDARQITDADLGMLLDSEWRGRLTAAWLIGLDRRTRYRQRLGDLLLESELVYAGQGYCFALARFGAPEDAEILVAYLDRYLPRTDCHYDQNWAMGALLHLDERLGSDMATRFLEPGGLWERSAFAKFDPYKSWDATEALCDFADGLTALDS